MSTLTNIGDSAFYYMCRLCSLRCAIPGLFIFSDEGVMRDVKKKIEECLHFVVDDADKYPKTICRECAYKLDLSHEFLLKSHESQQFLAELVNHEVFDTIYVIKNGMQSSSSSTADLCLELNGLQDHTAIHDFGHLVDEAHMHADSSDITQIIQYHDGEINDDDIQNIHPMESIESLQKDDTDSLPDMAMYTFDSISGPIKDEDFLPESHFQNHIVEPMVEADAVVASLIADQAEPLSVNYEDGENVDDVVVQQPQSAPPPPPPEEVMTIVEVMPKKQKERKSCEICNKTFATNYKLTEHQRTHSDATPFTCPHHGCDKKFRSKIGLTQHEARHTGDFRFACEQCGKGFQVKSYLTIHMKVHSQAKPYKCSTCGAQMKAKQALIDHENRHLGVKAFVCGTCDRRFISRALLVTHEKSHATQAAASHKYPCTVCHKLFVRRAYLKTHMTIHSGNKPYICDVCGHKFLTALDLKLHASTHTGVKGYVCEICGKAFIRQDSLTIHKRSHSGERPYNCKFCDQRFAQINSMKIHQRLHTGEKPYECHLCSKRFVSRGYLQTHLKKHTPDAMAQQPTGSAVYDEHV